MLLLEIKLLMLLYYFATPSKSSCATLKVFISSKYECFKIALSGVSRVGLMGVSKSRKFKWLVKVGASKGVTPLI